MTALIVAAFTLLAPAIVQQAGSLPASSSHSWEDPRDAIVVRSAAGHEYVKGEILLGLEDWSRLAAVRQNVEQRGARVTGGIPRLSSVKVTLPPAQSANTERAWFETIDGVRWATLNHVGRLHGDPVLPPNDTHIDMQWHLVNTGSPPDAKPDADIDILEAWRIQPGDPNVVVAVIDSGIKTDHIEFEGRLTDGFDFVTEDPDPHSGVPHGNLVAGALGANGNNRFGVSGVDTRCSIMPLRAMTAVLYEHDIAQALDYVANETADVVNMSWGFTGSQPMVLAKLALQAASDAGCILVAAAGNEPFTPISADESWPASSPLTISIGWTDRRDYRAIAYPYGSPSGQTLDFVAPGLEIATVGTSAVQDGVTVSSGSSLAAPIAAGIASLILAERPGLMQDEVYDVLRWGAEDEINFDDPSGWDEVFGHGRLNAGRSLSVLCECDGSEDFRGTPLVLDGSKPQALTLDAGLERAGGTYLILGSAGGTLPGQLLGSQPIPLNPGPYWWTTLTGKSVALRPGYGRLDDRGRARAQARFPDPLPAGLNGLVLHHAYVLLEDCRPAGVSSAVPMVSGPAASAQVLVPAEADLHDFIGGDFQLLYGGPSISVFGDVLAATGSAYRHKAYVFRRQGVGWVEEQVLTESVSVPGNAFSSAVAAGGDNILVGAPHLEGFSPPSPGAVYAYRWNGSCWKEIQKLVASDAHGGQRFGWSLAVSGDVAVVGARFDNELGVKAGAAYVFRWDGSAWVQHQKLSSGMSGDEFGSSVAIDGDVLVVGSRLGDGAVPDTGVASIFRWDGSVWVEQQQIAAGDGAIGDGFGSSVALSESLVLIGAHRADEIATDAGAAYLFQRQGTVWVQIQKLLAPEGTASDFFGWAVDIEGDRALVGSPHEDYLMPAAGTAYLYQWRRSQLCLERRFFPPGGGEALSDQPLYFGKGPTVFGAGVAIGVDEVLIGAPLADPQGYDTGAVYRFPLY